MGNSWPVLVNWLKIRGYVERLVYSLYCGLVWKFVNTIKLLKFAENYSMFLTKIAYDVTLSKVCLFLCSYIFT